VKAPRKRAVKRTRPPSVEPKRDATRRRLLERALKLFQQRGVEATTMRDIARAAGLSLGAAYYYFPSKDALVFSFYEDNQRDMEQVAAGATGTLRERLGVIFHGKLESISPHRKMLAAIVQRLVDPGDPLSAFSQQSRAVRERAIAVIREALVDVPADLVPLAAHALWLLMLAMMLVYINDDSPGEQRTHGLVDDALDMVVPMLPLLATPMGKAVVERVTAALSRADIVLA
jgi:AcrR family transcriptional regulator